MPLSIQNSKAERLARQVAAPSGETITQAILHALEERLERMRGRRTVGDMVSEIL
jgi:antitoxin VapB